MPLSSVHDIKPCKTADEPTSASTLCADLRTAHDILLKAMAEMAIATQTPLPDRQAYTAARWRLSKASRDRRAVWEKVYQYLLARVGPAEVVTLSRLAAANAELRRASTGHIGRWSGPVVDGDWVGYCEASQTIRWRMMSIVRQERSVVLPMLERIKRV